MELDALWQQRTSWLDNLPLQRSARRDSTPVSEINLLQINVDEGVQQDFMRHAFIFRHHSPYFIFLHTECYCTVKLYAQKITVTAQLQMFSV